MPQLHHDLKAPMTRAPPRPPWAMTTFVALFAMNMLDYLDRNLLMSMQPQIKGDLGISNFRVGPADQYLPGELLAVRPGHGLAGRPLPADLAARPGGRRLEPGDDRQRAGSELRPPRARPERPRDRRGDLRRHRADDPARPVRPRAAGPADVSLLPGHADRQALGISLGLDHRIEAELAPGVLLGRRPGLAAALLALALPEPVRGASEGVDPERLKAQERAGAPREDYLGLMVNSSYTYSVFGMATYTFAIGGMLVWVPNYLFSTRGFDQARAGDDPRGGHPRGGGDRNVGRRLDRRPPGEVEAPGPVPGPRRGDDRLDPVRADGPFFDVPSRSIFAAIFLAETLMFVNTGPCNAIIANVVQPNLRAAAYAISIFAVTSWATSGPPR